VENLGRAFQEQGFELFPLSLEVPRYRKLWVMLTTLQYDHGRVRAYSSVDPRTYRRLKMPREWEQWQNKPVMMFGDGVILSQAPHFLYRDLDYQTVWDYRKAGIPTYMYDHFPDRLLRRLIDHQRRVFDSARVIFTMSEWIRQRMIAHGGIPADRVVTVGAGANVGAPYRENPYTEANADRGRFVFVGRDFQRKGGDLLLDAWRRVAPQYPKARLVIMGPEAGEPIPGIEWRGPAPAEVIQAELRQATAFVMPSLWEPFGVAFLEAMRFGVPCVGMNRMAMPEFIHPGETGQLLQTENPDELAAILIHLLENPGDVFRMSQRAFQMSQSFSWSRVAAKMQAEITRRLGDGMS